MTFSKGILSQNLFEEASEILVGGVNSPVRAFRNVGGSPLFIKSGNGARIVTEDGQSLIDYVLSWGPMILGHAHPDVLAAISGAIVNGTSFGAPTRSETVLGKLIQGFFPSVEKVRFVNSGTEACMSAIRLARGFTGRRRIVKFDGCYHGHADSLLVAAGSGALTHGEPDSAGVLPELAQFTSVLPYNDIDAITSLFAEVGHDIAAVIVEPVAGNMGVVLPKPGFLETLRSITEEYESVLIFDEVMTGFRVHLNGAQSRFGITPDLTCLGKVIGGGLPCAAYGGRAEIMNFLSPVGAVYQAGTLSGNPVAMAAGIATLNLLKDGTAFEKAARFTSDLASELRDRLRVARIPAQVHSIGTMWSIFFTDHPVTTLTDAMTTDKNQFKRYYWDLLESGIYLAPSPYESNFVSSCHSVADLEATCEAVSKSLSC
ncbi:glutamate-1-semialdehyde-2,1-aminomutase [bacterium]|nr:glutamate-1-semialdehyde-2,1-aminomutase [bacterium]